MIKTHHLLFLFLALIAAGLLAVLAHLGGADHAAQAHNAPDDGAAFAAQINTNTPSPTAIPTSTPLPTFTPSPTVPPDVPFGAILDPNVTPEPLPTRLPASPIPSAVPTAGPSPTPGPGLISAQMGIQIHPYLNNDDFNAALNHTRALGLTWIKFQYNWSLLESAPGQYTDTFYLLRQYVQRAHDQGFKVLLSVAKAPGWSRVRSPDGVLREDGPPEDPQALANFISGMLSQIGVDVYGAPYVSAVEVWNEPNLQREWYGHPLTGTEYMRYFIPAYNAVRSFSPAITVITAAPAPTGDSPVSTNDRTWMQQLYNAGLANYGADVAVGVHPYGWGNAANARCCATTGRGWDDQPQFFYLDTLEDYRQIMLSNGHGSATLWGTEFGWATFDGLTNGTGQRPPDPPDQPFYGFISQWQQAEYILQAFHIAQDLDYVGPMFLWNLNFATIPGYVDRSHPQSGYGILDPYWRPRPAYVALQDAPKQ